MISCLVYTCAPDGSSQCKSKSQPNNSPNMNNFLLQVHGISNQLQEGIIWVAAVSSLDQYREAKGHHSKYVKGVKEVRSKKDGSKVIPEFLPVQKHARIQDHLLILTEIDGSEDFIELEGCDITAVSGGDQPSRKWAKRYPIKVENKNQTLAFGSKICLIYLETSWEKEAWCKALRFASRTDQGRADWYRRLKQEFDDYSLHLSEEYPSLLKMSSASNQRLREARSHKADAAASKMRHFLKKLAKKASKTGNEMKRNSISALNREDAISFQKKSSAKTSGIADNEDNASPIDISSKVSFAEKDSGDQLVPESSLLSSPSSSPLSGFGSQRQSVAVLAKDSENNASADTDGDHERSIVDEGTLCWNVILSRFFFDVKYNFEITSSIQARIQRLISKARAPSYIGGITCTQVDLGKSPPHILNMRVLPVNMDEAWALEADVEYFGGALLDVETRLEVCEPSFHDKMDGTNPESNLEGDATADLLRKGLETLGEDLEIARDSTEKREISRDSIEKRDEGSTSG
eukprot:Gb_17535 [translate_table: standard]